MYSYPLFASKQTFARIDFLGQGWRLVNGKGTHNVKICTEKLTRGVGWRVDKWVFKVICL